MGTVPHNNKTKTIEHNLPLRASGRFPPSVSSLLGLGFSSVSSSRSRILVRKIQSTDLLGRPRLFCEIEIRPDCATLRYSLASNSDQPIRRLHATSTFLRVLSLLPGISMEAQPLCALALPPLEAAEQLSGSSLELLSKKNADLSAELDDALSKNRALEKSSEESALSELDLCRRVEELSARLAKLESVSDATACELVFELVSSHRGTFNAAQFSAASGLPPSRAEEGLERLIEAGALLPLGKGYSAVRPPSHGQYALGKKGGLFSFLRLEGRK